MSGSNPTISGEALQARIAAGVEQLHESVMMFSGQPFRLEYVNAEFERQTGYGQAEILGEDPHILWDFSGQPGARDRIDAFLGQGKPWSGRLVNRHKNGGLVEVETTISPIRDVTGRLISWIAIGRDVTYEIALERKVRQAQKMEAIGTLAGGIAHDFNNILWGITGFAELTLDDLPEGGEARDNLVQILQAASRAKKLVEQILIFSRQGEQEKGPLAIGSVVKEALKLIRATLPTTIEIRREIDEQDAFIWANSTQIHQVMLNLCSNAAHAMSEKGGVLTVRLAALQVDADNIGQYPELAKGPWVELGIADTGIGMESEMIERIFDPFFTTKNPVEGTGMGLAAVHGIVTSHGGFISVKSQPGEGSAFRLFFPRVAGGLSPEQDDLLQVPLGTERILFVDDEDLIVEMATRLLDRLGYRVEGFTDSREALRIFTEDPENFDLVITDQTMPRITGLNLARELIRVRADIPIILCSGFTSKMTEQQARDIGIRAYLNKPLIMAEIAHLIREVLDGRSVPDA